MYPNGTRYKYGRSTIPAADTYGTVATNYTLKRLNHIHLCST